MTEPRPFHIHIPQSMAELLNLYNKHPSSRLMAGATYMMNHQINQESKKQNVLSLLQLEELKKISRTEQYAELGSCVTINTMLHSWISQTSPLLAMTLGQMGPYPIRNRATIGGNLCIPRKRMDLFPVLLLLDARLEFRYVKRKKNGRASYKSRWIPMKSFLDAQGELTLGQGEVLTRIRIPYYDGKHCFHRKVNIQGNRFFTINALTTMEKNVLSDIRLAFTNGGPLIIRSRDLEAQLLGRRFPLTPQEIKNLIQDLDLFFPPDDDPYENYLIRSLIHELLEGLANPEEANI